MEEDADLKLLLERRKLEAMRNKLRAEIKAQPAKPERSDREVVLGMLYDRGDEVLDAAYSFFPRDTERLVRELAQMIRTGRIKEKVRGGELLSIFRQVGLRFSLKTSIKVQDRGKFVDISEKLSRKED
ncbi:MAG: double-stranded DNA-binding protein [Thaumarchaeota archaeon]|nr:double-stranded DNA-binding protein [Nitrososphaerota archaeon]